MNRRGKRLSVQVADEQRQQESRPLLGSESPDPRSPRAGIESPHAEEKREQQEAEPSAQAAPPLSLCELIVAPIHLGTDNLDHLIHFGNAAYFRSGKSLLYYSKTTKRLDYIQDLSERDLLLFDHEFQLKYTAKKISPHLLSEQELNKIALMTGHRHDSEKATPAPLSPWHEKNGVDLLLVNKDPAEIDLNSLPFTNAAYLRYKGQLWYVKKKLDFIDRLNMRLGRFKQRQLLDKVQGEDLERFDLAMKATASQHRHLSDLEMEKVQTLTKHIHRTAWQKFLSAFGTFCVGFLAVGCGISTAAGFIAAMPFLGPLLGLSAATAAIVGPVGAATCFFATTIVNWWIFKRYVAPVLISLLGREKFLIDEEGKALSWPKTIAMIVAVALAASVAITFAALTYTSTLTLPSAFAFLGAVSAALPPVGAILAGVTAVCMLALMLKDIADLIKKKDVWGECVKFAKNMVDTNPEAPQNKGKSRPRILAERITTVVLTAVFIPLAAFGLYMTMNACAPGVKDILTNFIPSAAETLANVVSLGLAFIGQIPFGVQTALQTIGKLVPAVFGLPSKIYNGIAGLLKPKEAAPSRNEATSAIIDKPESNAVKAGRLFLVCLNAIGNGFISMMGAMGSKALQWLSLTSGTANSAFAGVPAVLSDPTDPVKLPQKKNLMQDDLYINSKSTSAGVLAGLYGQRSKTPLSSPETSPRAAAQSNVAPRETKTSATTESPRSPAAGRTAHRTAHFFGKGDVELMPLSPVAVDQPQPAPRESKYADKRKAATRPSMDDSAIDYHDYRPTLKV